MADLISHPFRIGTNGAVVTRADNSSEYYNELLTALCLTITGERVQVPLFGINDPAFATVDVHELSYKAELFGPPVKVVGVKVQQISDTTQKISVQYVALSSVVDDDLTI